MDADEHEVEAARITLLATIAAGQHRLAAATIRATEAMRQLATAFEVSVLTEEVEWDLRLRDEVPLAVDLLALFDPE